MVGEVQPGEALGQVGVKEARPAGDHVHDARRTGRVAPGGVIEAAVHGWGPADAETGVMGDVEVGIAGYVGHPGDGRKTEAGRHGLARRLS